MISDDTSFEFFLQPLAKKLAGSLSGTRVMFDRGPIDESYEMIEVFFALSCGDWIDENTVAGASALIELCNEAADAIALRCSEIEQEEDGGIYAVGILDEASWVFGAENVLELEPMLGWYHKDDLVGKVKIFMAYVLDDAHLVSSRCLSSKKNLDVSFSDLNF